MAEEEVVVLKPPGEQAEQEAPEEAKTEAPEEIVSLESIASEGVLQDESIPEPIPVKKSNKKLFIIAGMVALVLIILIVVLLVILLKKDKKENIDTVSIVKNIENNYQTQNFGASKIDEMINKANQLYERGNKFEALKIYENVAVYNQSLSNYNLGVSQMKQERCDEAIVSFNKAITDRENTAVSAINAAVCSLELNNTKNFNYYIGLADSFLQYENNSPLYSYYYALINYYKGNYYEALQALSHPNTADYKNEYAYLSAKILSLLGDDERAIAKLEGQKAFKADFTLAQLYARLGKYDKARDYLTKASKNTPNIDLIKMTEALIDLKTADYGDAAAFIKDVYDYNASLPSKIYKIKTILKPDLFDVSLAQAHFSDDMFFDRTRRYETLFYFAPYKVFDAKQSIEQIRKGGVSVFLDDTSAANDYLSQSAAASKVNAKLSEAIAKALSYRLKEANKEFEELASTYPNHSILQYNLALSYAQLGNFSLAAKHFIASYHQDVNNHLSGIFGAICLDINRNLNPKLIEEIGENLENDKSLKPVNLYASLLSLISGNQSAMIRWLEEPKEQTMLNLAFDIIIAKITNNDELMVKKADELLKILPNDIIANILTFISKNKEQNVKEYAKAIQIYFNGKQLDSNAFYHGADIIKKQYIKLLQISGLLTRERDKLRAELKNAPKNINLIQTLAYVDIFTNDFDESYKLYNQAIDEFKVNDASTLFLASVAATGAGKVSNAIALLELTKLNDASAIENRIALGLMYQQIDNIKAALIQYSKIGNVEYESEFYGFEIDND
ncbi:GTP pyrophosphokinase [Campylobacter concisus]|uniref:tetratricopeptide repeat protein n=1 Tax=Campylobacter concisus TaxID=199 RepID=UPI000B3D54AE|nr:tetratricopeptide repeat protein [Campylobacter concisus]OUT10059.1 GTP pyrophosphokinase [Campylobacter concisus]